MYIAVACLLSTVVALTNGVPGNITTFTQTPSGIAAPGSILTFNCQAVGEHISWYLNGSRKDPGDSSADYSISDVRIGDNFDHRNLTLTILARADGTNNNTRVECFATGSQSGQEDNRLTDIIIASAPLPPQLTVEIASNGTLMNITWNEPYYPDGFPIISYNLTVYNQSSNSSLPVSPLQADTLQYIIRNPNLHASICHILDLTITARNRVGISDESTTISDGFPIFPQIGSVAVQEEVNFDVDGNPWIHVEFQLPEVCEYQDPAVYVLMLYNETGHAVASIGPKLSPRSEKVEENFFTGILKNKTYVVKLTVRHGDFTGEATRNKTNIVVPLHGSVSTDPTGNHELLIISMASLGVAVVVCIVLALTMTSIACICRKGRRPVISEYIDTPLSSLSATSEFKLAPPPKGKPKVPTSLPAMAVNPIYAGGPTYESPGGESFRSLLGNQSSVPSTPLDPGTPTSRYFDMPPNLPPPRKAVGTRPHPPPGIPEEPEPTCCNGKEMSTTSLVKSPDNIAPAVIEAMGGGEYAYIRK